MHGWCVRAGRWHRYSQVDAPDEAAARVNQRGLWQGAFVAPWDWRHRGPNTVILGGLSVPVTARAELLAPASSAGAPDPGCTIKGNVNRNGEHIYHLPGQLAYSRINMTEPGKRWFCTAWEAEAAGWRPALR
jgi:hypothetical protein